MSDPTADERFPEPDESQIRPGETRQEWSARNAATAAAAAQVPPEHEPELAGDKQSID